MIKGEVKVGAFYVQDSKIIVGDPCYLPTDHEAYILIENALPGEWVSYIDCSYGRVAKLKAYHVSDQYGGFTNKIGEAPVDSGQMGIFDQKGYLGGDNDDFYDNCCNNTTTDNCGIIKSGLGVVSQTGYGDGMYSVYTKTNSDKKVFQIEIDFLEDEEDDEY